MITAEEYDICKKLLDSTDVDEKRILLEKFGKEEIGGPIPIANATDREITGFYLNRGTDEGVRETVESQRNYIKNKMGKNNQGYDRMNVRRHISEAPANLFNKAYSQVIDEVIETVTDIDYAFAVHDAQKMLEEDAKKEEIIEYWKSNYSREILFELTQDPPIDVSANNSEFGMETESRMKPLF